MDVDNLEVNLVIGKGKIDKRISGSQCWVSRIIIKNLSIWYYLYLDFFEIGFCSDVL